MSRRNARTRSAVAASTFPAATSTARALRNREAEVAKKGESGEPTRKVKGKEKRTRREGEKDKGGGKEKRFVLV